MAAYENIVILTGAGLSAESGLSTFRGNDGLWDKYNLEDVATPEGFARNPVLVHDFYNMRRQRHQEIKPNYAHVALAKLEHNYEGDVLIVTQNIDALHEAAGSKNLIHMHGEIQKALCGECGSRAHWLKDITTSTPCPSCQKEGGMRPDVVWFGEMPYHMERIYLALQNSDLFISIGTSGTVYPAAGFVVAAKDAGAKTVELNLEPSEGASLFDEAIHGPATKVVPGFVEELLQE